MIVAHRGAHAPVSPHVPRAGRRRPLALLTAAALALPLVAVALPAAATTPDAGPAPAAEAVEPNGLKGEYFTTSAPGTWDFATLQSTVTDPAIDFPDLVGTLDALTGRREHVTARWTGKVEAEFTEDYTFTAIGDNGFRVWVGGELLIDHWVDDWDREQTATHAVPLVAGQRYDVTVEYFQAIGGANMFLRWQSPSQPKEVVPPDAWYPPDGYTIFPADGVVAADGASTAVTFDGDVVAPAGLAEHLTLLVDGYPWPVAGTSASGSTLTLASEPISAGSRVRLGYDGDGGLTVGGALVPQVSVLVTNASTDTLRTQWGDDLDVTTVLPEYPRPQLTRERWLNLNGVWEFAATTADAAPVLGTSLDEQIVVPFAVESELSGIQRREHHMQYRRLVDVPADWDVAGGERVRLNFGAVDFEAAVYVNGTPVGTHRGGYQAFSLDITDALVPGGPQEVVVVVHDSTDGRFQAVGKQTNNPGGIFYTPTSGIWQTVWLEPVPVAAVDAVVLTPDVPAGTLAATVQATGASPAATADVVVRSTDGAVVGTASGAPGATLTVPVPDAHLWTPDDPYLYDVTVTLTDGATTDVVESYTAMRSIEVAQVDGVNRILLNGERTFLLSTLDQGYWPDGQYTPASDEAYVFDLQAHKDLGFNTVRKHIKVEPARWYYHADRLGLMVWQDIPSGWFADGATTTAARDEWVAQAHGIVDQLRSVPSIVGWVLFNEGWGEWDLATTGRLADELEAYDPTRLLNTHSGVNCCASKGDSGTGDIIDWHMYTGPANPQPDATRAAIDGEHGGFSLSVPGHMWPGASANPYGDVGSSEALTTAYVANTASLVAPAQCSLSGSVYTQISDVENEVNGFYTYDRRVLKMDADRVRAINEQVIAAGSGGDVGGGGPGTPGLAGVGAWAFDEGAGTVAGDGVGANDLALRGGAGWTEGHDGGGALLTSGAGQFAETQGPVLDTTGSYSVSAWVRLDQVPGGWVTAVSQDAVTGKSAFFLQYGQGGYAFSFPDVRATVTVAPELGVWHHLTGVRDDDADLLLLYLDGVLVGQAQVCGGDLAGGPLAVGRALWQGDDVDFWPGAVDGVRVFDRALSAEEVAQVAAGETGQGPAFADVDETHPAYTEIRWLADEDLDTGTTVGEQVLFRPADDATRADVARVLYAYAGEGWVPAPGTQTFRDVRATSPDWVAVEWMAAQGLTDGVARRSFGPTTAVTREQLAAFLHRLAGEPVVDRVPYRDVRARDAFAPAISWVSSVGIAEGTAGRFLPDAELDRAAMAVWLYRYDQVVTG